jgi:hypothetical protein
MEVEKEKKRKIKKDKVDAQKANGTYMTKSEKDKAKKLNEKAKRLLQNNKDTERFNPDEQSSVTIKNVKIEKKEEAEKDVDGDCRDVDDAHELKTDKPVIKPVMIPVEVLPVKKEIEISKPKKGKRLKWSVQ